MIEIKPGDYVDVRMVAVAADGDVVTVRLPAQRAVHEIAVGRHQIMAATPRSPAAIAADAVCSSYGGIAPLQARRARHIVTR